MQFRLAFGTDQVGSMGEDLTHRFDILRDPGFYGCMGQPWGIHTDSELVYLD